MNYIESAFYYPGAIHINEERINFIDNFKYRLYV